MNFVFISPNYPCGNWKYVSALCKAGINVLGIGDAGYETFEPVLKGSMTEYYRVGDLHDYDQVYRACAFFIHKYGRIDMIESLNPYWRDLEAGLRYDFHINGVGMKELKSVLDLKKQYVCAEKSGVAVVPHIITASANNAMRFSEKYGFEIFCSPIKNKRLPSYKISSAEEAQTLLGEIDCNEYMFYAKPGGSYISCDGITDADNKIILCTESRFAESPGDAAEHNSLLSFCTMPCSNELSDMCNKLAAAFSCGSGFFHFDFIAYEDKYMLVKAEFNPPPEYVADAMCCACGTDVYDLWARVKTDSSYEHAVMPIGAAGTASRRFDRSYSNTHESILNLLGARLFMHRCTNGIEMNITGDYIYTFIGDSEADIKSMIQHIQN